MPDLSAPAPMDARERELVQLRQRVADLERQLLQSQKLLAIGSLAGGVAHDFNNLLTAILGYASMLRDEPAAAPEVLEAADVIEKAADRASQLTARLLGFAKSSGEPVRTRVDVHQTLREVVDLLRRTIDKNVRIDLKLEAAGPVIEADPGQVFQVFLNLALNARDAMPGGGTLTLLSESAGGTVRVSVMDTGLGIPPGVRERMFEPFFTTKPLTGTGMGLTVVQSVVRAHGGLIEVDTDKAFGTVFTVILPRAGEPELKPGAAASTPAARGRGTVLMVDDEEYVRQAAARMLKGLGYQVVCAASAMEAIEYYRRRGRDIDLVVVDMLMPEMGGRTCFESLRQIDPLVRVVLTSGFARDAVVEDLLGSGAKAFLAKPYRMVELSEVLSQALTA
jgi:CheY-like chemotaxis protein